LPDSTPPDSVMRTSDLGSPVFSSTVRHKPTGIRKVEVPDGKSEDLGNSKGKRVLSDGQAYEVTKILKQWLDPPRR